MLKKWCLFICLLVCVDGIELKLSNGLIKGKSVRVGHQNLHTFKKIPFARPPLGELRFKKPQPVSKWAGTLDSTEYGPSCMINITRSDYPVKQSEDCLNINVFTSDGCLKTKKCPIFVMVHGGAFIFGNSVQYNDTQIFEKYVQHEIIFVLPAYRVGLFGFFDFGEDYEDAPYNVGLYDLIAAMNWTQHEISNFGGDPKKVTLMGYSSGATAIQYLMSSPQLQSHKLFSQVILSSGLPIMTPNLNREITERFLEVMECSHHPDSNDTLSIEQKLKCLRERPAEEINLKTGLVKKWWGHLGPQSSKSLLPARSYFALAERRTPIPLLVITSQDEMGLMYEPDERIEHVCQENILIFDYIQNATIKACAKKYHNDTYSQVKDTYHAIAVRECQVNSKIVQSDRSILPTQLKQVKSLDIKVGGISKNIKKKAYEVNEVVEVKSQTPSGNITHYAHTREELLNMTAQLANNSEIKAGPVRNLDNVLPKIAIGGVAKMNAVKAVEDDGIRDAKEGEKIGVEEPTANLTKWAHDTKEGEKVDIHGVRSNDSAQVYSRHPCYLGIFAQVNRNKHADDILYMIGQHLSKIGEFTENDKLMDKFYPNLIRNFVYGRPPTEDWLPTNAKGENYYLLNFDVSSDNLEKREWPHLVANETYDPKTIDFYLKYLNAVENNASQFHPENRSPMIFGQSFMTSQNKSEEEMLEDKRNVEEINQYERLYGYTSLWTIILFTILILVFGVVFSIKKRRPSGAYWTEEPPIAMPSEKTRLLA